MRKIKLTKLFTIKILLLGIFLFLLASCEIENDEIISAPSYKYKIEKVTFPLYQNNISLLNKIDEFNSTKKPIDKFQNKTANSEDKYKINTKEAIYIENTEGTHHTYSFEISNKNPLELQNIVLSLQADGNYKAYLTTYQISKQERIDIYNGVSVDLSQRTSIKEIDINQLEYANKAGGGCYDLVEVGEEWCDHPGHRLGDLIQGYCNHPKTVYGWVEEPCPGIGGGGVSFSIPSSDVTLYNSGGNSSSNGGTITTSPVALECDYCSSSLSLTSYLNLTDQSQIDWVNNANNNQTVTNLSNFGDANQWDENTTTISLQILNALSNTTNSSLSFEENIAIKNKATEIFDIIATNNFSNIDQYSLADQETIVQNSLFISFLPNLKDLGIELPQTAEEWAEFGEFLITVLKELIPELIPGVSELNSLRNAISSFNKGSYADGSTELAFAIVGVFPVGKAWKIASKAFKGMKIVVRLTKAFKNAKKLRNLISSNYDDALKAFHKIGTPGNEGVRVLANSSEKHGKTFFEQLTKKYTKTEDKYDAYNRLIIVRTMPDGSKIQYRNWADKSDITNKATIQFLGGNYNKNIKKIKFNE